MPEKRTRRLTALTGALALVFVSGRAAAQQRANGSPSPKRAEAVRLAGSISVDGHLDDAAWRQARFISDFEQKEPVQFAVPDEGTEVAFMYDDQALYVALRMQSRNPSRIPHDVTRRDQYGNSEHIVVSLDPFFDRRTAYSFSITAGGVRRDYYHARDSEDFGARDFTYDPVWEAKSRIDSTGWTAEMRIPFTQLRMNTLERQRWGLNINRWIPQRNEDDYWVVVPRDQTGFSSRFGTLEGLDSVPASRQVEFLPYVAANADVRSEPDPSDPFAEKSEGSARLGADLKVGLGKGLVLNATVNPDFAQVEADPAQLNLTAFETIYPERRPFFTEAYQYIEGPVPNYFYSRRIGAHPRGPISTAYADVPDFTTILGAAKLTGRLGSRTQVGALAAVTQREIARTFDPASGLFDEAEVEPTSLYGVARVQRQFGASQSTAGFSVSGMRRFFSDDSPLEASFSTQAVAGGADWAVRFQGGRYVFSGHAGMSYVEGSATALNLIQTSSAHYYQRPDAKHSRYDPARTSMTGYTAWIRGDKNAGNWLWGAQLNTESPGFEANDMGRVQSADDIELSGDINYRMTTPGRVFRRWGLGIFARTKWNYDGDRGDTRAQLFGNAQFANYIETQYNLYYGPRALSDDLTRGGPMMQTPKNIGGSIALNSNFSKPNSWRIATEMSRNEIGGSSVALVGNVGFRPSSKMGFSLDPQWFRLIDKRQYVTTLDGGLDATYDKRYVFATADQTVLAMTMRLNYTFNPDVTLELFAQPFTASGEYSAYGEQAQPRVLPLREYGTDGTTISAESDQYFRVEDSRTGTSFQVPNQNFSDFSFRSSVVLRWEWRRGSTLYFVLQQNRAATCSPFLDVASCPTSSAPGTAPGMGSLSDVFGIPGDNFLAVKINYWLPVR
jgi:hypothetical protein